MYVLKAVRFVRGAIGVVYLHQSARIHRYDKYNFARKASRKAMKKTINNTSKGPDMFQLDPLPGRDKPMVKHIRQKTLANALQDSLAMILTSNDVPAELQAQCVEITEVHVSADCSTALALWITEDKESEQTVEQLLRDNIDRIRMVIPTYHYLTHTPSIHFEKDKKQSYLQNLDLIFSTTSRTKT